MNILLFGFGKVKCKMYHFLQFLSSNRTVPFFKNISLPADIMKYLLHVFNLSISLSFLNCVFKLYINSP